MPDRAVAPLWLVRKREALSKAIGDEALETLIWLDAAKAGGTTDPEVFHVKLCEAIRTRCGEKAEEIISKLSTPQRRRLPWLRPAIWAASLLVAGVTLWRSWELPLKGHAPTTGVGMYFILVDRFADGSPDPPESINRSDPQGWHGGDIAGIRAHLDEIDALGFDSVWISPVSEARDTPHGLWGAYHGYWVERIDLVDPRFGTLDELRGLADDLHKRGMRLYLDVVYNHVAPDAELLTLHPDWFHHEGDISDWNDPTQVINHDVHGLPDLAQEKEEVYAYLRDASLSLVREVEPDGFRVDAVRHLPPGFLARLGDELRTLRPGFQLLGEVLEGDADRLRERILQDRLDMVFDFPLAFAIRDVFCEGAPIGRIASTQVADYGGAWPITLVDNHDLPRIQSLCHESSLRVGQALTFLLVARGTPSMTYGTESALSGLKEPDNRSDMPFGAERPYETLIRERLADRAISPSLREGKTRIFGLARHQLSVARIAENEVTVIHINQSNRAIDIPRWSSLRREPEETMQITGAERQEPDPARIPPYTTRIERWKQAPEIPEPLPLSLEVIPEGLPPLGEGDRVVLVGAGRGLGEWKPQQGVPLGVDGRFLLRVHDGEVLSFKLAVVHPDGSTDWEPHPDRFWLVTTARWTSGGCGALCIPAEDGAAQGHVAWSDLPLLDAVRQGDEDTAAYWLSQGADPSLSLDGQPLVEWVVAAGNDRLLGLLLDAGASLPRDILCRAFARHNMRLMALLLEAGAAFDETDPQGMTPIMHAARASNWEAVLRLKQLGADLAKKDLEGRTARDHAVDPELRAQLTPN